MEHPFVSVAIVTYNHEKFIEQCIESVFAQKTNFDFDVIVGEDCSTDNTRQVLMMLEQKYPGRLKPIYHQKNVGFMSNSFDYCFPRCKGKYIACIDGDDYWCDDKKLQMQVDALEKDKTAVISFTAVSFWDNTNKTLIENPATPFLKKDRFTFNDILDLNVITTSSVVYKNVFTNGLPPGITNFKMGDWPIWLFLLLKGDAIFIDKITTVYRIHNSGVYTPLNQDKRWILTFETYERLLTYPEFKEHATFIKQRISDLSYNFVCNEIRKKDPDKARIRLFNTWATKFIDVRNMYYPVRSFLRSNMFILSGGKIGKLPKVE